MSDKRRHRGAHPEDPHLFAPENIPALRQGLADLSWLLSRGYAMPSSLKLVGDRYALNERQRTAIMRCACSDQALEQRTASRVKLEQATHQPLLIDGYNVLTTLEAALAGGLILMARDGCCRDIASIHGTYRKVEETIPALQIAGKFLQQRELGPVTWYLDAPVSNSGRLKGIMLEVAKERGWDWQVEVVIDPDYVLTRTDQLVASADSVILDRCQRWVNLAREIVEREVPAAWIVDLGGGAV